MDKFLASAEDKQRLIEETRQLSSPIYDVLMLALTNTLVNLTQFLEILIEAHGSLVCTCHLCIYYVSVVVLSLIMST